ncbi:alpha amylase C-terminal domain-containing protein [Candidatus Saccharibacteria bacterium]|nr:alpha amylase C-terminal domain-containing protein [Candidatus Saccharibacteria bacterium]
MSAQPQQTNGVTVTTHGVVFWLWAPFATSVTIMGDFNDWSETATPLVHHAHGYWRVTVKEASVGQQYKYCIVAADGRLLKKNDPRALQLTASGDNAIIVDPDFDWQDDSFTLGPAYDQVIYELHIGTFNRPDASTSGTFDTAIEKLGHLAALGITAIELMPCSENWMDRWWGYTPDYLYAVESAYGGRHALMRFVREAHKRGIGVLLDVVYNHLSPDPGLDLWQFDGWSENGRGGIYFYNDWRAVTPWGDTRLDYGRPEVRQYITENVRMWLRDCHVDGLRVDSTHYIRNVLGRDNDPETDIPDGWQLLRDITTTAREASPDALLIAEDSASNRLVTEPVSAGGLGFNAQWETPLPYLLREVLGPGDDSQRDISRLSDFLQACDPANPASRAPFSRIIYSESHDADANGRARLNEEISPGDSDNLEARRRSGLAAALILTAPGIPMLFQGQEFMEEGSFSNWRALDWDKAAKHSGIILLYRDLIAARRNLRGHTPGLQGGLAEVLLCDEETNLLAYRRYAAGDAPGRSTVVVFNFSSAVRSGVTLPLPADGEWHVRLNSDWQGYSADFAGTESNSITAAGGQASITIGPYSLLIYSQDT